MGVSGVTLGVGIHPGWVHEALQREGETRWLASGPLLDDVVQGLAEQVKRLGAVAIGECGLDRPLTHNGGPSREHQRALFEAQLILARQLKLPVVLHVVGEHGVTLEVLERVGDLPAGGVVHGYSGSPELVPRYLARGLMISFGSRMMSPSARRARESLQRVPLDALLVETDAPDQAPPVDGRFDRTRSGLPGDLPSIVDTAARLLGLDPMELGARTARNASRLFG